MLVLWTRVSPTVGVPCGMIMRVVMLWVCVVSVIVALRPLEDRAMTLCVVAALLSVKTVPYVLWHPNVLLCRRPLYPKRSLVLSSVLSIGPWSIGACIVSGVRCWVVLWIVVKLGRLITVEWQ